MFKIFGVGRLGRDAETRNAGETTVTGFSVALDGYAGGEKIVTWVDCSMWGTRGARMQPYLTKGTAVGLSGDGRLELYTKRDGSQGAKITCRIDSLEFAGSKQDAEEQRPAPRASSPPPPSTPTSDFDDDGIPF